MVVEVAEIGWAVMAGAFAFVAILALHWMRIGEMTEKQPHVMVNYVLGVVAFVLPWTVMMLAAGIGKIMAVVSLWVCIGCAGLADALAYWVDDWAASRKEARQAKEREKLLEKKVHDTHDG